MIGHRKLSLQLIRLFLVARRIGAKDKGLEMLNGPDRPLRAPMAMQPHSLRWTDLVTGRLQSGRKACGSSLPLEASQHGARFTGGA